MHIMCFILCSTHSKLLHMTIMIKEINLVYQEEEMTYVVKTFFSFQRA